MFNCRDAVATRIRHEIQVSEILRLPKKYRQSWKSQQYSNGTDDKNRRANSFASY